MAVIEMNALSVCLSGSFAAKVFAPSQKSLSETNDGRGYPVLFLLHDDGGDSTDFLMRKVFEDMAKDCGIYLIAPNIAHSFGVDMDCGVDYETFLKDEFPGICHHLFGTRVSGEGVWIAGIGTGGYAAMRLENKYPEVFDKAISWNAQFDIGSLYRRALAGEELPYENAQMLEAVFGSPEQFATSFDLYQGMASDGTERYTVSCDQSCVCSEENQRLCNKIGTVCEHFRDEYEMISTTIKRLAMK